MDCAELSKRSLVVSDFGKAPGEYSPKSRGVPPHRDSVELVCGVAEESGTLFAVAVQPGYQGVASIRPGQPESMSHRCRQGSGL